jgi:hypothetical protein
MSILQISQNALGVFSSYVYTVLFKHILLACLNNFGVFADNFVYLKTRVTFGVFCNYYKILLTYSYAKYAKSIKNMLKQICTFNRA